jgi:hypothetical protein
MKQVWRLVLLGVLALALPPANAVAQSTVNSYVLQSPSLAKAQTACQTYGMTLVSTIRQPDTYLVTVSAAVPPMTLEHWVQNDPNVKHLELNHDVRVPESKLTTTLYIPPMPVTTYATGDPWVKTYGATAWVGYVQQPAFYSTNAHQGGLHQHLTGNGIVAVIDTGVDPGNPILAPVLVPGYDFTRNVAGYASDLVDINQSTASILEQSTASILESLHVVQLNQSTAAILEQSTASILKSRPLPSYFGHGTMVAGLIHLVAPTAKIMPLKAFKADGAANVSDVIRAIYYATDNGANVINMSFELSHISDALVKAINYATRKGVICVASAGNEGQSGLVYPAAYGGVIGVGAVNQENKPSSFTNYGPDLVTVAAPGEALITTYPGKHYAAVWGTSFSAALVSGATEDLLQAMNHDIVSQVHSGDIVRALKHANPCVTDGSMGAGCMDLNQAVQFIKGLNMPH